MSRRKVVRMADLTYTLSGSTLSLVEVTASEVGFEIGKEKRW